MKIRVHRGTEEIGGSCVELAADDGSRLVLDIGRPLSASPSDHVQLPAVAGLTEPDPTLLGVVVSHPHLDHYGLLDQVHPDVPVWIGAEAAAVLDAAAFFSPLSFACSPSGFLQHRRPVTLGPFQLTPYLVDHSAFDSYALLVEADGQRLFYTGDLRAHGRKAALFDQLLEDPPSEVDTLLMEGTHVRSEPGFDDVGFPTEADLEDRFVELCRETTGAVVVFGSAQNLDRLVTLQRAALRADRTFVLDLYAASVCAATRPTMPQVGAAGTRVYVPNRQRVRVKESGEFDRVAAVRPHRLFPEQLAAAPGNHLLHMPSSTVHELLKHEVLTPDGVAVWSLWRGYLEQPSGGRFLGALAADEVPLVHVHTSGHAAVRDLQRLVDRLIPGRVVPIHSEGADRYEELFDRVDRRRDGEWFPAAETRTPA